MPFPVTNTTPHTNTHPGMHNVVLDVKNHFGAVGDNVANDRDAIQAALDALPATGGGALYFPKGTYLCTGATGLSVGNKERISIYGNGPNESQLRIQTTGAVGLDFGDGIAQPQYFQLRNIGIRSGLATGGPTTAGIRFNKTQVVFIQGCDLADFGTIVRFETTAAVIITGNMIHFNPGRTQPVGFAFSNGVSDVTITGNAWEGNAGDTTNGPMFLDLLNPTTHGQWAVVGNVVRTDFNTFLRSGTSTPIDGLTFQGNTFADCYGRIVNLRGGGGSTQTDVLVTGNVARGTSATAGFEAAGTRTRCRAYGNVLSGFTNPYVGFTESIDTQVVATASLPAAATAMNGQILIEDAGAGDRNLIIYAGGQRFRIDGGANV